MEGDLLSTKPLGMSVLSKSALSVVQFVYTAILLSALSVSMIACQGFEVPCRVVESKNGPKLLGLYQSTVEGVHPDSCIVTGRVVFRGNGYMVDSLHVVVEEANANDKGVSNQGTHHMVPWSNIRLTVPEGNKTIRMYVIRYDEGLRLENMQLRGGTIVTLVVEVEVTGI